MNTPKEDTATKRSTERSKAPDSLCTFLAYLLPMVGSFFAYTAVKRHQGDSWFGGFREALISEFILSILGFTFSMIAFRRREPWANAAIPIFLLSLVVLAQFGYFLVLAIQSYFKHVSTH